MNCGYYTRVVEIEHCIACPPPRSSRPRDENQNNAKKVTLSRCWWRFLATSTSPSTRASCMWLPPSLSPNRPSRPPACRRAVHSALCMRTLRASCACMHAIDRLCMHVTIVLGNLNRDNVPIFRYFDESSSKSSTQILRVCGKREWHAWSFGGAGGLKCSNFCSERSRVQILVVVGSLFC